MTYTTQAVEHDDVAGDPPEEDVRLQLQDRIAELIAELSDAADSPSGVQPGAPFSAGDVDFETDAWMNRLGEVQAWLRFSEDLPLTDRSTFVTSLAARLGFDSPSEGVEVGGGVPRLTEVGLERLGERAELAARLQQAFLADLYAEGGTRASATASWVNAWESEEDADPTVAPDPVTARADVWPISQLTGRKLNLAPSYQRGDVWRTGDRQALVESILRGIPLPSVILLRTGASTPHEVVDGKQRLTAILRFVGKHPVALAKVAEVHQRYPDVGFLDLYDTDYARFRAVWRKTMGFPLTTRLEDEFYFPFKLRSDANGALVGAELEVLRGKYYTQIRDNIINVADEGVTIKDLFEAVVAYKMPVIEYTKASQRQIHEVFKLYNKQGMHLNAEEIRNAVYHDVELTRAILVAAGDASARSSISEVAPSLSNVRGIADLGRTLAEYGFGEARYRRTKVLGTIVAVLVNDSRGKLLPSTARHTDLLLEQVQAEDAHLLREPGRIADLFGLLAQAVEIHASHDELWPEPFRGDGKSSKWQDLQLVGSLVGIAISLVGAPDDIERRIEESADAIHEAASTEWKRPAKTQTRTQWDYIARIAAGVVELLDVDIVEASATIRKRYGSSGVESLLGSRLVKAD